MMDRIYDRMSRNRTLAQILVSLATGGLSYFITNFLIDTSNSAQLLGLTLSVFIGGLVLVTQFLLSFEGRMTIVESAQERHAQEIEDLVRAGFSKINEATELFGLVEASALQTDEVVRLIRHSTKIQPTTPRLIYCFAQSEIARMSEFLKELSDGGNVTYEGEDRDWMLSLTRNTETTIDATSLTAVDAGGRGYAGGLWNSDLGQRYLDVQRDALARGVRIRRVFIVDRPHLADEPDLLATYDLQREMGIEVRVLDASTLPGVRRGSLFDFIVFDETISYEVTPATLVEEMIGPTIVNTRLELRSVRVRDRIQRFKDIWASARELDRPASAARPARPVQPTESAEPMTAPQPTNAGQPTKT